jgi:hypothetical protein
VKHLDSFVPTGAIAPMEPNPNDFRISPGIQPYIKLHGSCNWVSGTSGPRLLIMAGQKAINIGQFPVLSWYYEEFRNHLKRPNAKLMIVGYSFSDAHINEAYAGRNSAPPALAPGDVRPVDQAGRTPQAAGRRRP